MLDAERNLRMLLKMLLMEVQWSDLELNRFELWIAV